jgi:tight adherence protein C
MNLYAPLAETGLFQSPAAFGLLVALAVGLVWAALSPAAPAKAVERRLSGYLERADIIEETDMRAPLSQRVVWPMVRGVLRALGRLLPNRAAEETRVRLLRAGQPGGLTTLDYYGLRLLVAGSAGGLTFWTQNAGRDMATALLLGLAGGVIGYMLPSFWLGSVERKRKSEIERALPNALDMLTVGVEAGLAFESAMLRVAERWDNALTRDMRRAVLEMRMGVGRNEALMHMTQRSEVPELRTFVAVLVQSTQLGVSIADVLHVQADMMRMKRRQRAERLAREAGIKMIFPLVFLVFPAMFVVLLGPTVPQIMSMLGGM